MNSSSEARNSATRSASSSSASCLPPMCAATSARRSRHASKASWKLAKTFGRMSSGMTAGPYLLPAAPALPAASPPSDSSPGPFYSGCVDFHARRMISSSASESV
jgi:hypothetical protein